MREGDRCEWICVGRRLDLQQLKMERQIFRRWRGVPILKLISPPYYTAPEGSVKFSMQSIKERSTRVTALRPSLSSRQRSVAPARTYKERKGSPNDCNPSLKSNSARWMKLLRTAQARHSSYLPPVSSISAIDCCGAIKRPKSVLTLKHKRDAMSIFNQISRDARSS